MSSTRDGPRDDDRDAPADIATAVASPRSPGDPLIQLHHVQKFFPIKSGMLFTKQVGAVKAVDDVSFDVARRETLGIVGETGCGKSTTARLIVRLLERTGGEILFEGRDIAAFKGDELKALRREMQMIFQDPYSSLNPRKSVGSIIADPFVIHGMLTGSGERKKRVQELMDRVGLNPEHYNRYPHEFSGGQRQRIGVARAMALQPKVLVADEPVSALDVSIQAQVLNLLRGLQREMGLTLIFIAHDLSVVRHMCDRIAVMYLGKVVELAPNAELYSRPRHPYTGALMSAVPVPEPPETKRERLLLTGDVPSPADPPSACRFHTRCPKAQEICSREEPPLQSKGGAGLVACHFPLTDDEIRGSLPAALARSAVVNPAAPTPNGAAGGPPTDASSAGA
jgi:peptide/nickel transport system ATP-binding protein/oligopeptide transport system ATP-binding protein